MYDPLAQRQADARPWRSSDESYEDVMRVRVDPMNEPRADAKDRIMADVPRLLDDLLDRTYGVRREPGQPEKKASAVTTGNWALVGEGPVNEVAVLSDGRRLRLWQ